MPTIRPLNQSEIDLMQKTLDEFTTHFAIWWPGDLSKRGYYGLMRFCYYEGCGGECCGDILGRAAPYVLGNELVRLYNFQWTVMADGASQSRVGVTHPRVEFLDIHSLEDGHLIAIDDRLDDCETYERGQATCYSLAGILALAGERWRSYV